MTTMTPQQLLELWRGRVRMNQRIHYVMEERCERRALMLGVSAALLSGIVGALILAAARYDLPVWLRVVTGAVSLLASVIATVATSAKWNERAAQHHAVAVAFGVELRRIEAAIALGWTEDELRKLVTELQDSLKEIPSKAPPVPEQLWKKIKPHMTPDSDAASSPSGASRVVSTGSS